MKAALVCQCVAASSQQLASLSQATLAFASTWPHRACHSTPKGGVTLDTLTTSLTYPRITPCLPFSLPFLYVY